jgi:hypothetical protein
MGAPMQAGPVQGQQPVYERPDQFGPAAYEQAPFEQPPHDQHERPSPEGTLHYERPPVDDFDRESAYGRPGRDYERDYGREYGREYDRDRDRPFYEEPLPDFDEDRRRRSRREPDDYDDEDRRSRRRRRESAEDYELDRERRADRARLLGSIVYFLTGLICTSFILHIVFNLFGANPKSGVVSFVHTVAQIFVFGLGDVFKPGDNTLGLVLNFGFAALLYFILGRLLARTLKQR